MAIRSLEELVERDMFGPNVAAFLRACGRPLVIVEEVFEADVPLPNVGKV